MPDSSVRHFEDLVEGTSVKFIFVIDQAQMEAFTGLSGDENPLHTDDAFAVAQGFRERVVYGGLIVAAVSRVLGMELPGRYGVWTGLKLIFRNPLYVGETAAMTATIEHRSIAAQALEISLKVETTDRVIAVGTADSVVRHAES